MTDHIDETSEATTLAVSADAADVVDVDGTVTARVSPRVLGAIAALERAAASEAVALEMATAAEARAKELREVAEKARQVRIEAETALDTAVITNRGLCYATGGREVRRIEPESDGGMRVAAPGATTR